MDDDEYRGKTFKSGNSVALRLPKGMGIAEGTELRMVRVSPTAFRVEPLEAPRRTIDVSGFAGKLPGFKPMPRDDFEERPSLAARSKVRPGE